MKLLYLFLIFTLPLFSDTYQNNSDIASDQISYNGDLVLLEGNVKLSHPIGKMEADTAYLTPDQTESDFPFSTVHLQNHVYFNVNQRCSLFCDDATIDFSELNGILASSNEKVCYQDLLENAPLQIESKQAEFQLVEIEPDHYDLQTLFTNTDVEVDYADSFHLKVDHALFQKEHKRGVLHCYAKKGYQCYLSHFDDEVYAEHIFIDLNQSVVEFTNPHGEILSALIPHSSKGSCQFSCEALTWDHANQILLMKNNVRMHDSALGTLSAENTLQLIQKEQLGKLVLQTIETTGKTTLEPLSEENITRQLTSYGTLTFDRDTLTITATSPEEAEAKQIFFQDGDLSMYSNQGLLEYSVIDLHLKPVLLKLKGKIRIFSHNNERPFRCGIADHMEYSPETQEITLKADPGKYVLFWHEEQNLSLCAEEIRITVDPVTGDESFGGTGLVRFTFNSDEAKQLQTLFPRYTSDPRSQESD